MDAYHLELDQDLINLAKSIKEASCKKEELVGNQKKIDVDGDGKIEASDLKKLRKEENVEEGMEELDELSKGTLGSYVNKAAKEARINGMISRDFQNSAGRKRNPGMKAAASSLKDKYQKKAWKREDGIKTAVGKLTKEQVEEIEALATKHGLGE